MVGVEDRNEDVVEEALGPSNVPDAAAPVPAPSAEDGGVIFVLEKASLEAAKVGKVKKTKEIPSPFLSGRKVGSFSFEGCLFEFLGYVFKFIFHFFSAGFSSKLVLQVLRS
jgi:hypothetical protein